MSRRGTATRRIYTRARARALEDLAKLHPDDFAALFAARKAEAEQEFQRLQDASTDDYAEANDHMTETGIQSLATRTRGGQPPSFEPVVATLKPGPRKPGEDVTDRLDVARCPECRAHHDRGHVCKACGANPALDVQVVLRMRTNGIPPRSIASRLGVTERAVNVVLDNARRLRVTP